MTHDGPVAPDLDARQVEAVDFVLERTKQVRERLDLSRPVDRDVLLRCIEVASRAPIGGNVEVNRWLIVEDPVTRAALAEVYARYGTGYLAQGRAGVDVAPAGPTVNRARRIVGSSEHLLAHLADVPVHIIPVRVAPLRSTDHELFDQATFWGSVLPGVWSLQLALRARGLGSTWTTLHLAHAEEAAAILGLPDGVVQCALLPVAPFTGDTFTPAPRRPPASITYLDRWGHHPS